MPVPLPCIAPPLAALAASLLMLSPALAETPAPEPVDLVDPFVGTSGDHGQLTPAATGPYGMVQLSPDTRPAQHAGYDHAAMQLTGFSHTRAVGVGCGGGGGDLHVALAYAGNSGPWLMDKATERAGPGWYGVTYGDGIAAELAANGAAGIVRFTLPRAGTVRLVIDPRHSYTVRHAVEWMQAGSGADLQARMSAGTVCDEGIYHLSSASQLLLNGARVNDAPIMLEGDRLAFDLAVAAGDRVELRTGLSVVDSASAARVLAAQVGGRSLEDLRAEVRAAWSHELARVAVPGDGEASRLFYTHLFRVMQTPAQIDDADGRYRRSDGSLQQVPEGQHRYAGWAVWDNYRTQLPLLALLDPQRSADIAASLAELYVAGKMQWATDSEPFITVRTEHAGVALLDFRRKGITGFDAAELLPLMEAELATLPRAAPDQEIETAYDIWAVAELAGDLGDTARATRLGTEALSYRRMWRDTFRDVAPDFDVVKARGLYQGTLWQYRWAPVFDLAWLMEDGLGRDRFTAELDRFFGDGLFNMTNQPDIQTPFLFAAAGQPDRTRALVDRILHRPMDHWYTNAGKRPAPWHGRSFALDPVGYADGMDDDAGGMAAWYVWASMGLYPLVPGRPEYLVTTPAFDRVTIRLPEGRTLAITRGDAGQPPRWNGAPLDGAFVPHAALVAGGELSAGR
ncbi:glycoside hydrolase domain-containing protein [Croceibacterium mercuriale]|uniref:glycoside hydrolase domain-containing protein n=1 Tax=Croceibacterium mercuriale TaxID=1572751 RepID=UPI00068EAE66|nr:glycoside hydrolase domain-containing protein [Croceibacterium mercuriale]